MIVGSRYTSLSSMVLEKIFHVSEVAQTDLKRSQYPFWAITRDLCMWQWHVPVIYVMEVKVHHCEHICFNYVRTVSVELPVKPCGPPELSTFRLITTLHIFYLWNFMNLIIQFCINQLRYMIQYHLKVCWNVILNNKYV